MTSQRTCVIIEDDADIRELIALILTDAGFEIHACETGHDGVIPVERLQPSLITLDLGLPDMDGREAAGLIAAVSAAPILMITAFAERGDELHGIAAGATAYLVKPFRPRQLRELALQLSPPGTRLRVSRAGALRIHPMKVMYTPLLTNDGQGTLESSPRLTLDAEYHVLALLAYPAGRVLLQLLTDDGHSLAWFDSAAFITVDSSVPESWEARIREGGMLELAPRSWQEPGFWEDYYDGDPATAEIVDTELRKMTGIPQDPGLYDLSAPMNSSELRSAAELLAAEREIDPWKGLMLVLLRFITELPGPGELQPALATAEDYWKAGKGTPETLEAAKASCGDYLKAFDPRTHMTNAETKFALALLCILEPLGDEDARSETADLFAGVVWEAW